MFSVNLKIAFQKQHATTSDGLELLEFLKTLKLKLPFSFVFLYDRLPF